MTDLRMHHEWPLLVQMKEAGFPLEQVVAFFGFREEDIRKAFGGWVAVESTRPKVAQDGTTACPRCSHEAWPVQFGMWAHDPDNPDPKAFMAGCVVGGDDPEWRCTGEDCGYEWRVLRSG
ncbi:hypothetical protein LVY72_02940 [Arthrobacter sp. I2-34]|uniref:Uncharacterized protein n=1 Tax=Arthrobacter hankyongi TaxID=2904801 RepID=A0ABS9L2J7_9MICC|nr:hypothetical protein [Arthrobacter hankyongi]MCG2620867.1 hypothetical protein [Arthrobacter hankyongi]